MKKLSRKVGALYDLVRLDFSHVATTKYKHILLACMPKSGSTYLSTVVGSLMDFDIVSLVSGYGRREQELDYIKLLYSNRRNYIAHNHVRYSDTLELQIKRFNLRPVVLIRDIFDACISVRDHYRRESVITPMAYAIPDMAFWDDERLEFFIASMVMPWYLNFYLSWLDCKEKLVVNYTEILDGPGETVEKILRYCDVEGARQEIENALVIASRENTRRNVAVAGRGQVLAPKARDRILEIASFYSNVDLTPIGIK